MNLIVRLAAFIVCVLVTECISQSTIPCTFEYEGLKWDLSAMQKKPGEHAYEFIASPDTYHINICADTADFANCPFPSPIWFEKWFGTCYVTGLLRNIKWGVIDPTNPEKGVTLTYINNVDDCRNFPNKPKVSSVFSFICDDAAGGDIQSITTDGCTHTITWPTRYGCPTTGGDGLGVGGIIIIVVGIGFILYLAVGYLYNMKFKDRSGMEAVPNIDFWRSFPGLVVDGCKYAVNKVRGVSSGGVGFHDSL